jgi:hypothetical protein
MSGGHIHFELFVWEVWDQLDIGHRLETDICTVLCAAHHTFTNDRTHTHQIQPIRHHTWW